MSKKRSDELSETLRSLALVVGHFQDEAQRLDGRAFRLGIEDDPHFPTIYGDRVGLIRLAGACLLMATGGPLHLHINRDSDAREEGDLTVSLIRAAAKGGKSDE